MGLCVSKFDGLTLEKNGKKLFELYTMWCARCESFTQCSFEGMVKNSDNISYTTYHICLECCGKKKKIQFI